MRGADDSRTQLCGLYLIDGMLPCSLRKRGLGSSFAELQHSYPACVLRKQCFNILYW